MVGIPQVPCQRIFLSLPLWSWPPRMICFSFLLWKSVSFSPVRGHHSCRSAGMMGEVMGLFNLVVKGEAAISRLGRDGLPINRWRGYISFDRTSLGRLKGLLHRPKERTREHAFPPQRPPLLDFVWLPDAAIAA